MPDKPFQFNPGRVNGAHIGPVTSKEELVSKLEAVNASQDQMKAALDAYDAAELTQKQPKKTSSAGKNMYDAAKSMMS